MEEFIHNFTLQDWVLVGTTILGFIKWYFERNKLPAKYQKILDKITADKVKELIEMASKYEKMTDAEKLDFVSEELRKYAETHLGITISSTIAKLIVQFVYQKYFKK